MISDKIMTAVKGVIVGGTMLVPGVSGGSMAIILGIYDRLVSAVGSFTKNKRENFFFLLLFALGGGLGMFLFANPLLMLIQKYPLPMLYFFLGVVAGGVPLIYKRAEIKRFFWKVPLYVIIGAAAVLLFALLPIGKVEADLGNGISSMLLLVAVGFIAAIALVLPGISVSYLLLLLGLYDETMRSLSYVYLPFLVPLAIGVLLGIILTTKILEQAMNRYPQPTYLIILGFVLGSMIKVFPGFPNGIEIVICLLALIIGFLLIRLLSWQELRS